MVLDIILQKKETSFSTTHTYDICLYNYMKLHIVVLYYFRLDNILILNIKSIVYVSVISPNVC